MVTLTNAIILCVVVEFTKADYCQENPEPAFNENMLRDLSSILLTGTLGFNGCPQNEPVLDENVKFLLYNRGIQDWTVIDRINPVQVDPHKPIKIYVHGWVSGVCSSNVSVLAKAYLQRYDCNVIGIDWSARAIAEYSSAFCSVPGVADIIAKFLCVLKVYLTQQLHTIGHSLGAQVLGFTGQQVQERCNTKIGRISGLDPAGPLFTGKSPTARLDSSDGVFVDVIHSNAGLAGYYGNCGDVDFYPNCGTLQNGCQRLSTIEELIALPISIASCSHLRSADYWFESINPDNKKFVATSCSGCPGLSILPEVCRTDIFNRSSTVMGEDCPRNPPASKFYVKTNAESPFARG